MIEVGAADNGRIGKRRPHELTSDGEARAAVAIAAGLYVVGASLTATAALLPHVGSPAGVIAVAATALLTAGGLMIAYVRRRAGLVLACVADLWGLLLIAFLCASTGGASSPFALIYFFGICHAAAFQPRNRFIGVAAAGLLAFLAPLAYEQVTATFAAVACVGVVLALLTSTVVYLALTQTRDQRRRLELLTAATATLDTSLDPAQTLRKIAHTAVPELAELCVIDVVDRGGLISSTVAAAVDPAAAARVERMRKEFPLDLRSTHMVARVLATGAPVVIQDLSDRAVLHEAAQSDERERFTRDGGYASAAVFPMVARGRTHGAISFVRTHNTARYEPRLLSVLEDLTGRAAMAFDNARLYAERARVARTLRRSLMPAVLPVIAGLELASYFRPMGAGNEVGGDFYDVFEGHDGCWLVVGDVCGKGAEAAALTGFLRHTTIAYARDGRYPARVLSQVNEAMLEQDFDGQFATAILAHLAFHEPNVKVTIAAAGHPAALVTRNGGLASELGDCGTLLGVFSDPAIEEVSTVLAPGDALALYTDGLSEAHAPERTVSAQEMIEQLSRCPPKLAKDAIDALLELVDLDDEVRDDIAIVAARVVSPGASTTR